MKKLLVILAIGAFAACNDSATSTETSADSSSATTTTVDTTMAPMATPDTMSKMSADTSKMATDTTKK